METFYIRILERNGASHFEQVQGTRVKNRWGYDLFARKYEGGYLVSDNVTGFAIGSGKTKKDAVTRTKSFILENDTYVASQIKNAKIVSPAYGGQVEYAPRYLQFKEKFRELFNLELEYYWDFLMGLDLGFDILKFDERVVNPRENESCADAIARQWGEDAKNLVAEMLKVGE